MTEGFLLAIVGILASVITSVVTFLLTKRKYRVEVHGGEIENKGHQIENNRKDLAFYIDLVDDNKRKLDELQNENKEFRIENRELQKEIAEIRSVVFSMLQQICTDMMCQNRKFDQSQCPYYETIFNLRKEDGAETQ